MPGPAPSNPSWEALGQQIRDARVSRGWSQTYLGQGHWGKGAISGFENGRNAPTPEGIRILAERLDLDPEPLLKLAKIGKDEPGEWLGEGNEPFPQVGLVELDCSLRLTPDTAELYAICHTRVYSGWQDSISLRVPIAPGIDVRVGDGARLRGIDDYKGDSSVLDIEFSRLHGAGEEQRFVVAATIEPHRYADAALTTSTLILAKPGIRRALFRINVDRRGVNEPRLRKLVADDPNAKTEQHWVLADDFPEVKLDAFSYAEVAFRPTPGLLSGLIWKRLGTGGVFWSATPRAFFF